MSPHAPHPNTKSGRTGTPSTEYELLTELGQGYYSTVWLARQERRGKAERKDSLVNSKSQLQTGPSKLVAIKIRKSNLPSLSHPDKSLEEKLASRFSSDAITHHILLPISSTLIPCPITTTLQRVIVLPRICGPSIFEYARGLPSARLPLSSAKLAIVQTIAGLHWLHAQHIGHGDLHTRNLLLLPTPDFATMAEASVRAFFARKPTGKLPQDVERQDSVEFVRWMANESIGFEGSILISDFGSSFVSDSDGSKASPEAERPQCSGRTVCIAPERLLGRHYDLESDIWSLACCVVEVMTGKELFWNLTKENKETLDRIRDVLGGLDGELDGVFRKVGLGGEMEEEWYGDMKDTLREMLRWEPGERIGIGRLVGYNLVGNLALK
jgi:serine/threonine-protein kinase SRPK3